MIYIFVFFGMFFADICWTFYLFSVEERKSVVASFWATAIYLFGAFVVSSYVSDKMLIIPAAMGSFVGTFVTIEFKKWRERKKKNND